MKYILTEHYGKFKFETLLYRCVTLLYTFIRILYFFFVFFFTVILAFGLFAWSSWYDWSFLHENNSSNDMVLFV